MYKWRLRAIPYLARNLAMISCGINFWVGFICFSSSQYRDGAAGTAVVGAAPTLEILYPSPYGLLMALYLMGASALTFLFERYSWMRPHAVRAQPWMWNIRVLMYSGLSVPGILMLLEDYPLMPPLIGSVCWIAVGLANLVSVFAQLPEPKEWAWAWSDTQGEKRKVQDEGGKYETFYEVVLLAPKRLFISAFEKNTLGRMILLLLYTALNVTLWIHAAYRHGESNKGRALKGEVFYLCGTAPCCEALTCDNPSAVLVGPIPILQPPPVGVGAGTWFPIAKGFGQLLNLNCAVLLLPVIRSAVMKCHDLTSLRSRGCLSWLPTFIPFDKNIVFHKVRAPSSTLSSHCTTLQLLLLPRLPSRHAPSTSSSSASLATPPPTTTMTASLRTTPQPSPPLDCPSSTAGRPWRWHGTLAPRARRI